MTRSSIRGSDTEIQPDIEVTRWLSASYFGALTLVATLAIIAHLLLSNVIRQQSDSATLINLAGRQRMLSQRIAFLSLELQSGDESARPLLKQAADLMDRSQNAIVNGGDLGIVNRLSPKSREAYFEGAHPLDPQVRQFISAARKVADSPPGAIDKAAGDILRSRAREVLLSALNNAVSNFEFEAKGRTERLESIQRVVTFIILVTLVIEAAFIFRPIIRKVKEFAGKLYQLATRDALTNLPNRRHFLESAGKQVTLASRTSSPVSVLMLDVDHFKKINDTFGHASGDAALRRLSSLITASIRITDIPGRMGGEEFAVVLPNTGSEAAAELAERIRRNIEQDRLDDVPAFTVSIGLTSSGPGKPTIEKMLAQADAALYQAKSEGRNRVMVASATPS